MNQTEFKMEALSVISKVLEELDGYVKPYGIQVQSSETVYKGLESLEDFVDLTVYKDESGTVYYGKMSAGFGSSLICNNFHKEIEISQEKLSEWIKVLDEVEKHLS